jgi:multiple sugar transport system substrate-binding protein
VVSGDDSGQTAAARVSCAKDLNRCAASWPWVWVCGGGIRRRVYSAPVVDRLILTRRAALTLIAAGGAAWAFWPRRSKFQRAPAGRTEIVYWEKWTDREGEAAQVIVDWFNESQDRIWVTKLTVADIGAKAMVAIGGGDPPDIVGLYNYNISQYAEAGAVLPIESFKGAEHLNESYYTPAVWQLLAHEGKQWGGVSTCHSLALYYNLAMFREAGIDRPPRTIAELDEYSERLTRRADGRLRVCGFHQAIPDWWVYFWPYIFGGDLHDAATNSATVASPEGIRAYEWVSRTAERLGRVPGRSFALSFNRSIGSADDPFFNARVPMIIQGPWTANFARAYAPGLEYGAAPMPVEDGLYDPTHPITMIEADVLMVPRGSPNPEAAFEFLIFTQRRDVHERLATEQCKPSGLRSISAEFVAKHPHKFIAMHNALMQSSRAKIQPRTRVWKQYNDMMIAAFEAIWGGADVGTELRRVQSRVQEVIDLSAVRLKQRRSASSPATIGAIA